MAMHEELKKHNGSKFPNLVIMKWIWKIDYH
jgi:hypothetical protein